MFCPQCRARYPDDWRRCPKDEAVLLKSDRVGKYCVESVVGRGGMGAVYRARNPDTNSTVAIKLLHPVTQAHQEARERFQREAATIAGLSTRHIVAVYDFGATEDGTLYLVMEFLRGHELRKEIVDAGDRGVSMPVQRINLVMEGALRGLAAAHRAEVTHRDLKPENIFIAATDDGEVAKVLDFGIARVGGADGKGLTESGMMVGTPSYMAPECVGGRKNQIGPWSDVYAMGVILIEMVTGSPPFVAESRNSLLAKVYRGEFTALREQRPGLPEPILAFCDRALANKPDQRFRDADEMRSAWREAYAAFDVATRSAAVPPFRDSQTRAASLAGGNGSASMPSTRVGAGGSSSIFALPVRRHWPAVAGAGLLGVAVVAILLTTANRQPGARSVSGDHLAVTPSAPPDPEAVESATSARAGPIPDDMVALPGGRFAMGVDPDIYQGQGQARRTVAVAPFLLDRTEMSIGRYREVLSAMQRAPDGPEVQGDPSLPVREVTWHEASAACAVLGKRLPSAAEWEFAAVRSHLDPAGARMRTAGVAGPAPVGTHRGDCTIDRVCDLLGNVAEWTSEPWTEDGSEAAQAYTVRGGSYAVAPSALFHASPHARGKLAGAARDREVGFRCARDGGEGRR
jgi:serine/threonine protein kinase/formylglycine-generating enzyme required for sulfatase activity